MDFQGFQNSFPGFVAVIAVLLLLAISWWAYSKQKNMALTARISLAALRASALIIVFFLLMNPFFYSSTEVEIESRVAVFLDNSESIGITKGEYAGLETYHQLLNELGFESLNEIQFQYYSIGEESHSFHPDSITATSPQTNLSDAVQTILEFNEEIKAAILISDGIITYSKNPVFSVSSSSIPLHTIAIGDTSKIKDISISNTYTNSRGYTNTRQNVDVEITQSGYANQNVKIRLISDEEIIQEKELFFETDDQVKLIDFELELDEAGLQQYRIEAETLPDEWSEANNSRVFSIDVLDSKVRILHIAFEIHPDVKTVRSVIEQDINNELSTLTWLGENRFIEEIPQEMDFNIIVIHGAPDQSLDLPVLSDLLRLPTLYFGTGSSLQSGNDVLNNIELIGVRNPQLSKITLSPLLNSNEHPILELPATNLSETPQLIAPLQTESKNLQSIPLFGLNYSGLDRDDPIIAILEQGNTRRAQLLVWDVYKLQLSLNAQHREYISELITNLLAWVASDPQDDNLMIEPAKQSFSTFENPGISAALKNESGENEDDAFIEVELRSEDGSTRSFNMRNTGSGAYHLNLPRLSEGMYRFEATARKGNREIERKNGEFLVSNSSSELTNTHRNDALMSALAENSGGKFFTYNNTAGFWDSLRTSGIFESQTESIEQYSYPVRSILWFAVVLVLLSAEWILRKKYSLP